MTADRSSTEGSSPTSRFAVGVYFTRVRHFVPQGTAPTAYVGDRRGSHDHLETARLDRRVGSIGGRSTRIRAWHRRISAGPTEAFAVPMVSTVISAWDSARWQTRRASARPSPRSARRSSSPSAAAMARPTATPARPPVRVSRSIAKGSATRRLARGAGHRSRAFARAHRGLDRESRAGGFEGPSGVARPAQDGESR
jgi:hypothetical protein